MSAATVRGRIVWIDRRARPDGDALCEVIYEVDGEPDLLRQIDLPAEELYEGATRGDEIDVVGRERVVPISRNASAKEACG